VSVAVFVSLQAFKKDGEYLQGRYLTVRDERAPRHVVRSISPTNRACSDARTQLAITASSMNVFACAAEHLREEMVPAASVGATLTQLHSQRHAPEPCALSL
jgi:hypothetical protein